MLAQGGDQEGSAGVAEFAADLASAHGPQRPVEHGVPVGLARHEHEPRARGGVGHRDLFARTSMDT